MATTRAAPLKSKGARMERKAWMARLRRVRDDLQDAHPVAHGVVQGLLDWGAGRRRRYDARPGGLGRR